MLRILWSFRTGVRMQDQSTSAHGAINVHRCRGIASRTRTFTFILWTSPRSTANLLRELPRMPGRWSCSKCQPILPNTTCARMETTTKIVTTCSDWALLIFIVSGGRVLLVFAWCVGATASLNRPSRQWLREENKRTGKCSHSVSAF